MATTVTITQNLNLDCYFVDGDTRTITVKDVPDTINSADIADLNSFIQNNNLLIGDKTGATFGRITKGTRVRKTTTKLDIAAD